MQHTEEKVSRNRAILAMYRAGATIRDLADEFGVSPQRIQQILRARGETLRPRTWRKGRSARQMAVCEMRAGGATYAEIIQKLHISGTTIGSMLDAVTLPDRVCPECGGHLSHAQPRRSSAASPIRGAGLHVSTTGKIRR